MTLLGYVATLLVSRDEVGVPGGTVAATGRLWVVGRRTEKGKNSVVRSCSGCCGVLECQPPVLFYST